MTTSDRPPPCRWTSVTAADRTLQATVRLVNLAPPLTGRDPFSQPDDPPPIHLLALWSDGIIETTSGVARAWAGRFVFADFSARGVRWVAWVDARHVERCTCP